MDSPSSFVMMYVVSDTFLSAGLGLSPKDRVQCAWGGDSCRSDAHQDSCRASRLQSATGQGEPTAPPRGHMGILQWEYSSLLLYHNCLLCVSAVGLQKEFFQDDVFPDTAECWKPALTASAWLSGSNGQHNKISLKPKDMTPGEDTEQRVCLDQDTYLFSLLDMS